ncbi:hypothetical protein J433_07385 [Corynebacterium glutamicum MT]|nr:hypothetical protein CgS9114_00505 [Corynebacterium glutamicum S9114]EOA64585.1 hypothetical protein J433_07385 [Corynebacterium glutamicum MT]
MPACHVAQFAADTHNVAVIIITVARANPLLMRLRVIRINHHCATINMARAASNPDSGNHCGPVTERC